MDILRPHFEQSQSGENYTNFLLQNFVHMPRNLNFVKLISLRKFNMRESSKV